MGKQPIILIAIESSQRGAQWDIFDSVEEALRALEHQQYDVARIGNGSSIPVDQFIAMSNLIGTSSGETRRAASA
ncbi:hypothetical protein [Phyllobacterium zundukense]|nr:hypothetical protein [Phyllobacterium zundukense]